MELHRNFPLVTGPTILRSHWATETATSFTLGIAPNELSEEPPSVAYLIEINAVATKAHTHFIVFVHGVRAYALIYRLYGEFERKMRLL